MLYKNFKRPYRGSVRDNFFCYLVLATAFYGIVYFFTTQGKLIPLVDASATQSVLIMMYGFLLARAIIAIANPMRHNMIFYYARWAKGNYIVRNLLWVAVLVALALSFSAMDNVVIYYLIAIKALAVVVPLRKECVFMYLANLYIDINTPLWEREERERKFHIKNGEWDYFYKCKLSDVPYEEEMLNS
ncbi:MAG: hypothetical protein O2809_00710 [Proteobacteria bacterium]|nr:hypothetical protein [Pseudomonadota bacterium]